MNPISKYKDKQNHSRKVFTMIHTYDMKKFSSVLKELRVSLGYSISDVSRETGINESTIKSFEKAKCFPRFDTLHIISSFYITDLVSIFALTLSDYAVITLMNQISVSSSNGDLKALDIALHRIKLYLESEDLSPIEQKEYNQIKTYIKGLIFSLKALNSDEGAWQLALDYYEKALLIGNSNFNFKNFKMFKYSSLEMGILFSCASIFGIMRKCEISNEMLHFLLGYYLNLNTYNLFDNSFVMKLYYLLAYNYHRLDEHKTALEYANSGIEHCINKQSLSYLPQLLARKGIALRFLKEASWREPIETAITLLKLQGNLELVQDFNKLLHE